MLWTATIPMIRPLTKTTKPVSIAEDSRGQAVPVTEYPDHPHRTSLSTSLWRESQTDTTMTLPLNPLPSWSLHGTAKPGSLSDMHLPAGMRCSNVPSVLPPLTNPDPSAAVPRPCQRGGNPFAKFKNGSCPLYKIPSATVMSSTLAMDTQTHVARSASSIWAIGLDFLPGNLISFALPLDPF